MVRWPCEWRLGKNLERSRYWPILNTIPGDAWRQRKTIKSHNKHSVPAEQNLKTATRESEAGMLSMVTYGGRKISNVTVGKQFLQM
jgi:hypothetical protein